MSASHLLGRTTAPRLGGNDATSPDDAVQLGPATFLERGVPDPQHVLRRLTYGPRAVDRADIVRLGVRAWIDRQLDPAGIDDAACDALLARLPRMDASIPSVRQDLGPSVGGWDRMFDLGRATIARAVWSERQLFELVVETWSNHFNVTSPSSDVWDCRAHYDSVLRTNAFGTFRDLLTAAVTHPAMLSYLGNDQSRKGSPNENLGRELLELHTVGVTAGYTEADVKASALLLTGVGRAANGELAFTAAQHHVGSLTVMGFTHANASAAGGMDVVRSYLAYLAGHPATARSIVRTLAVRFVSDVPSDRLVSDLAAVYLRNDTAIVPVLRALFADADFAASAGAKLRRPLEDVAGTLRAFGVGPDTSGVKGFTDLYWILDSMGHAPLAWHPPNGYPDVAVAWASAAGSLARWNVRASLLSRWWPVTLQTPTLGSLLGSTLPTTWGALVDRLSTALLGTTLPDGERAAILSFVPAAATDKLNGPPEWWNLTAMSCLVMSTSLHTNR